MQISINSIVYQDRPSSNARLIIYDIPKEGQTYDFILQGDIDKQNYPLSSRNGSSAYNIPTNLEKVYLNFVPQKISVSDSNLKDFVDIEFNYFKLESVPLPELFNLPEGQIFRCVKPDSLPMKKEDYTYYIIQDSKKKLIPNYKTLEVMLAERNQTLLSVRVVQENQCNDIELLQDQIPDKSGAWQESMSDKTTNEVLTALNASVKSGAAIADAATKSAGDQIAAVKAQAAADKAAADAAKAQSIADKAAADAAIAQAQAAQSQADAAKAAADLALAQIKS